MPNQNQDKTPKKKPVSQKSVNNTKTVVAAAIALVCGLGIGHFAFGSIGVPGVTNVDATIVSSDQTGEVIATYTYKGKSYGVSIQDIIDARGGTTDENGNFEMPSTETIISYCRSQIEMAVAKDSGIKITDEDMAKFLLNSYGIEGGLEGWKEIVGDAYTDEQIQEMLTEPALLDAFRNSITEMELSAPTYPEAPAEGAEDEATESYMTYIKTVAGDAWDEEANAWADADSDFAKATADMALDGKVATYEAASAVYQVAYNAYALQYQQAMQIFNDYMDTIYKDCTISIGTMVQ